METIQVMWCPKCFGKWAWENNSECSMCKGKEILFFTEAIRNGISPELWEGNKHFIKETTINGY